MRSSPSVQEKPKIWWSNLTFFISFHLISIYGIFAWAPWSSLKWETVALWFVSWQLASFGITLGYHRLWSHNAYTAALPLRIVLAGMGCLGFQGSIRWWVLRHRLHHRYTDDPIDDPYAASRGLFFSHCGWIAFKPTYTKMKLIDREDLDQDPVVRFQHKHYLPLTLGLGLVAPTILGSLWGDALGGFVWGGLVARLFIWHTTFCINSLAHWTGLQPYTDEISARGNYFLALLTSGEANHNFHHKFAGDFRNGPNPLDWDPTKWIIWSTHKLFPSLIPSIKKTPESEIHRARANVLQNQADELMALALKEEGVGRGEGSSMTTTTKKKGTVGVEDREKTLPVWSWEEVRRRVGREEEVEGRRCFLVVEGWVVDVSGYLEEHPGGASLLRSYSIPPLPASSLSSSSPPTITAILSSSLSSSSSSSSSSSISTNISSNASSDSDVVASSSPSMTSDARSSTSDDGALLRERGTVWRKDATHAFNGGMNKHSRRAKEVMRSFRVARVMEEEDEGLLLLS